MKNKIQFIAIARRWFDRVNGNTYHSVQITRTKDKKKLYIPFQYGYGDHYRQSALASMLQNGWITAQYGNRGVHCYERENGYPIEWSVTDGLKRDCIANGKEK